MPRSCRSVCCATSLCFSSECLQIARFCSLTLQSCPCHSQIRREVAAAAAGTRNASVTSLGNGVESGAFSKNGGRFHRGKRYWKRLIAKHRSGLLHLSKIRYRWQGIAKVLAAETSGVSRASGGIGNFFGGGASGKNRPQTQKVGIWGCRYVYEWAERAPLARPPCCT